jgi:nickel-type superoxide dismutase maturation protease
VTSPGTRPNTLLIDAKADGERTWDFRLPFVLVWEVSLREPNWTERLLYFFGRRTAFLVEGDSMSPTLNSGDTVLVDPKADINVGDIVLADHPYKSSVAILKRVAEISADGRISLAGDNQAESTDSRTFGPVSIKSVIGRVECRLS